jgi:hypothetical protein
MTRLPIALAALTLVASVVCVDLALGARPNPFKAPPMLAFGSGAPASGGHCASLPSGN